jgi:hypothetical protein
VLNHNEKEISMNQPLDKLTDSTVNLTTILKELEIEKHYSYQTLYDKFKALMGLIQMKRDDLKDESGEIWFFEEEKEFIKQLILEVDNPYLKIVRSKKSFKGIEHQQEEAANFEERMLKIVKNIKNPLLKEISSNLIEILSNKVINEKKVELLMNLKFLLDTADTYNQDDLIQLIDTINNSINVFKEKKK